MLECVRGLKEPVIGLGCGRTLSHFLLHAGALSATHKMLFAEVTSPLKNPLQQLDGNLDFFHLAVRLK